MNIGEAIEIVLAYLPKSFDVTDNNKFLPCADLGELKYFENANASINISVTALNRFSVNYYSEDDNWYYIEDEDGDVVVIDCMSKSDLENRLKKMFEESIGKLSKFI